MSAWRVAVGTPCWQVAMELCAVDLIARDLLRCCKQCNSHFSLSRDEVCSWLMLQGRGRWPRGQ